MIFHRLVLGSFLLHASNAAEVSEPSRISFHSLSQSSLLPHLHNGLVSLTNLPHDFASTKREVMSHLHSCLLDTPSEEGSVQTQYFADGTVRRSIASVSLPRQEGGGNLQPIPPEALSSSSPSCLAFRRHLDQFRGSVDGALYAFASKLSSELGSSLKDPLMETKQGSAYHDVKEVVEGGEHLEHFHSYQKSQEGASSSASSGTRGGDKMSIEFHTDQGFFLAFVPGMTFSNGMDMTISDGFYIEDANGRQLEMKFDQQDDLVFMLGDGVNQYINNKLKKDKISPLRATPHALTLTPHNPNQARVWYGRMVLPPSDAYHFHSDATYGEMRQVFVDSAKQEAALPLGIGCSSPNMVAMSTFSRSLAEDGHSDADNGCAEDEMYCWFRCMPFDAEEVGLTPQVCAGRNLKMQCTNHRDQVLPEGKGHGDWFPGCTNSTAPPAPYPEIDQRDDGVCTDALWDEFNIDDSYDHVVELTNGEGTPTFLMYSIIDGKIKARITHDDVFGWLALGFANPGGGHNGMNGGNILLAKPGTEFDPASGLVVSDSSATVDTHVIDVDDSAFRHWQDPIETPEALSTMTDLEVTDCFTAFAFESDHINGKMFNLTGTDDLIWAGNSIDHWMGYHGGNNRRRFTIHWEKAMIIEEEVQVEEPGPAESEEEPNGAGHVKYGALVLLALTSFVYM